MQVKALCEFLALRALSLLVLLLAGEHVHPTVQLLRLVTVSFICYIGGENRKLWKEAQPLDQFIKQSGNACLLYKR